MVLYNINHQKSVECKSVSLKGNLAWHSQPPRTIIILPQLILRFCLQVDASSLPPRDSHILHTAAAGFLSAWYTFIVIQMCIKCLPSFRCVSAAAIFLKINLVGDGSVVVVLIDHAQFLCGIAAVLQ